MGNILCTKCGINRDYYPTVYHRKSCFYHSFNEDKRCAHCGNYQDNKKSEKFEIDDPW